jgi:hypothetical protein
MGAYWLHDLPAELRKVGLDVMLWPGWETRSRKSGGLERIWAVFAHHTAGPSNQSTLSSANQQYDTADLRPVGNLTLGREGLIVMGAAGAANTQGAGGPLKTSKGTIPKDQGNIYGVAIEACNNGIGELWTPVQLEAYTLMTAVICDLYGLDPLQDVFAHFEWAPSRKIDPAGGVNQYPYGIQSDRYMRWDMARFRSDVRAIMDGGSNPPDMSDFKITDPVRILDTRSGTAHNGHTGDIPVKKSIKVRPHGYTDKAATGVILTLTSLPKSAGYFTLYSGNGNVPVGSNLNVTPGVSTNNMVFVPLAADGTFTVYSGGPSGANGLIIDQVGWYVS